MQPPNWSQCTEEEAWHFVAWHLEGEGNFDQALLICRRQKHRVDLDAVRDWCLQEGGIPAFVELLSSLSEEQSSD